MTPRTKQPQGRKVWSIDLQTVWLPFFTATNAMGDTAIPSAALGCPLRLGYDKAGAVRFTPVGRPVIRVAKEISDGVRVVRDNVTANLLSYAGEVQTEHAEEYNAQLQAAVKAGEPIFQHDKAELDKATTLTRAEAEAISKRKPSQKQTPTRKHRRGTGHSVEIRA